MSLYDVLREEVKNLDLGIFRKEEQERRIAICEGCENFNAEDHKCGVCKCSIAIVTLFTQNSCPSGKWRRSS